MLLVAIILSLLALPALSSTERQELSERNQIVGGSAVARLEYPTYVQGFGCGGVLVWHDIALTAAHCQPAFSQGEVLLGATQSYSTVGNAQWRRIVSPLQIHPKNNEATHAYDFMMFKVEPATDKYLFRALRSHRVKINSSSLFPADGQPLTVIGFGATQEGGPQSPTLLKAQVQTMASAECQIEYGSLLHPDSMLCAGVDLGGKDSCQGDSGGHIFAHDRRLVGLVSFGVGCARPDHPGVYSRISAAASWIKQTICELTDQPPVYCPRFQP